MKPYRAPIHPATDPQTCRSCGAEIYWVEWEKSKKRMPVDSVPDMRPLPRGGSVVLSLRGGAETGKLIAESYVETKHGKDRNRYRYTSHFCSCPQAGEWRNDK